MYFPDIYFSHLAGIRLAAISQIISKYIFYRYIFFTSCRDLIRCNFSNIFQNHIFSDIYFPDSQDIGFSWYIFLTSCRLAAISQIFSGYLFFQICIFQINIFPKLCIPDIYFSSFSSLFVIIIIFFLSDYPHLSSLSLCEASPFWCLSPGWRKPALQLDTLDNCYNGVWIIDLGKGSYGLMETSITIRHVTIIDLGKGSYHNSDMGKWIMGQVFRPFLTIWGQ